MVLQQSYKLSEDQLLDHPGKSLHSLLFENHQCVGLYYQLQHQVTDYAMTLITSDIDSNITGSWVLCAACMLHEQARP
jgi:hypothetical protein